MSFYLLGLFVLAFWSRSAQAANPQEPITLNPFFLRIAAARAARPPRFQAVTISLSFGISESLLSSCPSGIFT